MMCTCKKTTSHKNHHHTSLMRELQSLIPAVKTAQPKKSNKDDQRLPRPVRKRMHVLGDPFGKAKSIVQPSPSQATKKKGFSAD